MRRYRVGAHTKTDLKVHLVWVPEYRKKVLTGEVAIRVRDVLRQVVMEHELEVISGKVAVDHVHMFIGYNPSQDVSKIVHWLKGISSRILLSDPSLTVKIGIKKQFNKLQIRKMTLALQISVFPGYVSHRGRRRNAEGLQDLAGYAWQARAYRQRFSRLRDRDLPESLKILPDIRPRESKASFLQPVHELLHEHQGKEAAEHMPPDGFITLMIDGPGI